MTLQVLITDTNRWPVGPRLAIALSQFGCEVTGLCPFPRHPFMVTRAIRSVHRYDGRAPVASLRKVIDAARPDLILPLCDRGVQHMHQLYWLSRRSTGGNAGVADLIERSIGSSACYDVVSSRYRLLQVARNEGILTPEMSQIEVRGDSVPQLGRTNLPWVVKADGTSGGRGVRIANTPDETRRAIRELGQRPGLVELAKRMLLNRDRDWIIADWKLVHRDLLIQAHIDGRPANCAVACWEGQVLAGACFEVLAAQGPKEPASIVRVIEHQAMIDTVRKMARRLQLSGFIGFDFMIENGTGAAYLIEMNPRCTTPVPISLGKGRDLVAALSSRLLGQPLPDRESATSKDLIGYFPKNWGVADNGYTLASEGTYYDAPEGEPALVQELLRPWNPRTPLGRALDAVKRRLARESLAHTYVFDAMSFPGENAPKV